MSSFAQPAPLLVAAAADLSPLEQPLSDLYKKTYKSDLRLVLGSSGMLASQIRHGAPYDVYLSANTQFVRDLEKSGHLLPETVTVYATGRLALWSANAKLRSLNDLRNELPSFRLAIANPAHAPYGVAARQALESSGLWGTLKDRIVLAENVRQTLQFAESGNAGAALLAWSLVHDRGGVLVPDSLHQPIEQSGGVVASSRRREDARRLMDLLTSPAGAALLRSRGFTPAR